MQVVRSSLEFAHGRWISLASRRSLSGMKATDDGWALVVDRVRSEIEARQLSPNEIYLRSRLDPKTLDKILSGQRVRSDAARRLTRAFGWTEESLLRIERGEEPIEEQPQAASRVMSDLNRQTPWREEVDAVLRSDFIDWAEQAGMRPRLIADRPSGFDLLLGADMERLLHVGVARFTSQAEEQDGLALALGHLLHWRQAFGHEARRRSLSVLLAPREPREEGWSATASAVDVVLAWPPRFDVVHSWAEGELGLAGDFAIAAEGAGDASEQTVGNTVNRPSPEPEPEGP